MLTIIPTPIGNLKDITLRALESLKECDLVLCEDTRRTLKLLSHFSLSKKILRYNEYSERSLHSAFAMIKSGKKAVLVSDSGSPCISDPGRKLVRLCREEGIRVVSLPGPSALTAAAAGSGLPVDSFVFLGFLPKSGTRARRILKKSFDLDKTVVIYASPHRLTSILELISETFGENTEMVVAREISKVFEEWICGKVKELAHKLKERKVKGELVILLKRNEESNQGSEL